MGDYQNITLRPKLKKRVQRGFFSFTPLNEFEMTPSLQLAVLFTSVNKCYIHLYPFDVFR